MSPIQQMLLGVGAVATKTYVDDIFSTHLYTGTGSARSINTGVDMTEGGLVWIKCRNNARANTLFDTARGVNKYLLSDHNHAENSTHSDLLTAFNNNGFSLGADANSDNVNRNNYTQASWTFRKAPGFFTLTSWVGNSTAGRTITHDLGCVPGMIIIKNVTDAEHWYVYHRGVDSTEPWDYNLKLDGTHARNNWDGMLNDTAPTSSSFQIGDGGAVNQTGKTYICYLFAGGESTAATARSVDFDGNDYLSVGSSSDFTLGTNNFTLETWIYPESCTQDVGIPDPRSANTNAVQCMFGFNSSLQLFVYVNGSFLISPSSSTAMTANQWQHVAYCRNGSTGKIYLNGIEVASVTDNNNYVQASAAYSWHAFQGATFVGKLSNVRIVNGTAVYTSSFRPPTEPLTNITNTKLLCCNNSSTTGSTVTPGTITANGDPTASTSNPFDDPAAFVFGKSGSESVIKCGSYVGDSSNVVDINLGWEPLFILVKNITTTSWWLMIDNMRGVPTGGNTELLVANETQAENNYSTNYVNFTSTGFQAVAAGNGNISDADETFVYLAVRRPDGYVGKPPELGTGVFAMDSAASDEATIPNFDSGFPVDFAISRRPASADSWMVGNRLMGTKFLYTENTDAEATSSNNVWDSNAGIYKDKPSTHMAWMWKRHAGMDVVAYTGNGSSTGDTQKIPHGLNQVPEMAWIKNRSGTSDWCVYHKNMHGSIPEKYYMKLNSSAARAYEDQTFDSPTATHFNLRHNALVNSNNSNFIMILFSSVSGISKVGSYTGTGNALSVSTGFAPRFLFIKNASTGTGDSHWWVVDTTRGWASGDDNCLRLDVSNAAVTGANLGAPTSTGFDMPANSGNSTAYNKSGDTYIYYAHA